MKTIGRYMLTTALLLGSLQPAQAASTNTIYTSGWLVIAFFGLCALVVAIQLVPAMMLLAGMLKALFTGRKKEGVLQRGR